MSDSPAKPPQPTEPPEPAKPPSKLPKDPPPGFGIPQKRGSIPGEREYLERRYGQR